MPADYSGLYDDLTTLQVPIFVAHKGSSGREFQLPSAWQTTDATGNAERLAGRSRTTSAVCAVLIGSLAVVDVDTKNGADAGRVRQMLDGIGCAIYAEIKTPSGGRHFYVPGNSELPNVSASSDRDGLFGYPGVEILAHGRMVFLPGTTRPKYDGAGYKIISDDLAKLIDGGDPESGENLAAWVSEHRARVNEAESHRVAEPWDGTPPDHRQQCYLDGVLDNLERKISNAKPGGRNLAIFHAGLACGNYIAGAGMDPDAALARVTAGAERCGYIADEGARAAHASFWSGVRYGKTRPRAVPPALPLVERLRQLGGLLAELGQWQHIPDPTHVVATLAAAATRSAEGEPVWLLLVAAPSSGKTETVRLLDQVADARLDEVTSPGLLGWTRGRSPKPTGVLTRVGDHALITFGDLSSLLATSDRGGRDQVFGLLRTAYDGHVSRDISNGSSSEHLQWSGRLTVVACVTGAIDRYTAHADALGPRWIYLRLPERTPEQKREAARLARRRGLGEARRRAADRARQLLDGIDELPEVPESIRNPLDDAALVATQGRAAVARNGYGRREIEAMPIVEEPMRLVQQLAALASGVLALGLPESVALQVARRAALDSIPEARHRVLEVLAYQQHTGELLSTAALARAAGVNRRVARMALEELAAIGVVDEDRTEADDREESSGAVWWSLTPSGDLIGEVFRAHKGAEGGCYEMLVYTSHSPQREGGTDQRTV